MLTSFLFLITSILSEWVSFFTSCYYHSTLLLRDTLERTSKVIEKARNCGWELQVNKNEPIKHNLVKVIASLEGDSHE